MSTDIAGIPNPSNMDWLDLGPTSGQWHELCIPRNAGMVTKVLIGNGASGGGGFSGASLTQRGGGGGGGSGGISTLTIARRFLPMEMYYQVPDAPLGGAAGLIGVAGGITYISALRSTAQGSVIIQSGLAGAGPGGPGLAAGAGAGGVGQTAAIATLWTKMGQANFSPGSIGIAGSPNTSASNRVWGVDVVPLSGGSGGAGVTAGNVTGTGGYIANNNGFTYPDLLGGQTAGADGGSGYPLDPALYPWCSIGGAGGASGGTGPGGNGGRAWIGCGGGGGGGGNPGGAGGNGGQGIIMIGFG